MRFNTSGEAVYGRGGVFVDGATPAALSGQTVQLPAWLTANRIAYVDGGTGAGPWTLKRLQLPATITSLDASGATVLGAGLSIWAAYLPGSGVRTSYALTLPTAYLLDVSRDGQMAVLDDVNTGAGLTVYDETGVSIFADATARPYIGSVRVNDDYCAYQDATGWHLVDLSTGHPAAWRPRTDYVTNVLPVVISSRLYVVEVGGTVTLRYANRNTGWQLSATPVSSLPDAMDLTGHVWAGGCTDGAESAASLVVWDATVTGSATISLTVGTIVGGALTFGSASTVSAQTYPVGPQEGRDLAVTMTVPDASEMLSKQDGDYKVTRPWLAWFTYVDRLVKQIGDQVQHTPVPNPRSTAFDQVASSGQPTLQAQAGATTLHLDSTNGTIGIRLNPATQTADLSAQGGSWIPLVDGSEPPNFITDGAGHLILVAYP